MGWLRIVRPGSVIGEQQHYLCRAEAAIRLAGEAFRRRGGTGGWRVETGAGCQGWGWSALVAEAAAAVEARAAELGLEFGDGSDWDRGSPGRRLRSGGPDSDRPDSDELGPASQR